MATTISSSASTGTISSLGTGSGLDLSSIISKLMTVEQQPLVALNTKEASYQAKLSAYGTLTSSVSSLKSSVDALKSSTLYSRFSATASDTTVLSSVSANSIATASTNSINVLALASAQTLTSQTFSSQTTATSTIDGKLKIEIGTYSGSTFTAAASPSPVTISISAANSSLGGIRDAINAANAGVTAKVVAVDAAGTQFKLSITSNTIGAAGSLRITAMNASGTVLTNNTDIAKFSYDPSKAPGTGNEYVVAAAAQDAHLQVNGVDIYRNSNVIGDVIPGVSLTASKIGSSSLTIAADTSSIQTALQAFVTAYNSTVSLGRQMSLYDSTNKTSGILTGDRAARNLLSQLSNMIGLTGPSSSSSLKRLSDMGISIQKNGSLSLDSLKLQSALSNSKADVTSLLSSTDTSLSSQGLAVQISSRLDTILSSKGLLSNSASGLQSRISLIGKRRTEMQARLVQVQANYQKQFTALDTMVASMQRTSSYLTTQLASITKSASA